MNTVYIYSFRPPTHWNVFLLLYITVYRRRGLRFAVDLFDHCVCRSCVVALPIAKYLTIDANARFTVVGKQYLLNVNTIIVIFYMYIILEHSLNIQFFLLNTHCKKIKWINLVFQDDLLRLKAIVYNTSGIYSYTFYLGNLNRNLYIFTITTWRIFIKVVRYLKTGIWTSCKWVLNLELYVFKV